MEIYAPDSQNIGPSLPFSSLRLLVPPLRLMSAFMWKVALRRNITHYGKLEEFVMLVTESIPELMGHSQRSKLILGLRTRVVLELCHTEIPLNPKIIQGHLDKLHNLTQPDKDEEGEKYRTSFIELVQTMLKDPDRRRHFFQHVFPVEYGPDQDAALQNLIWEFLSRVEELLPAPDLKQTASWLRAAPSALEDCVQPLSEPEELKNLFQHHKYLGQSNKNAPPSSFADCVQPISEPEELKNLNNRQNPLGQNGRNALPSSMGDRVHSSIPSLGRERVSTQQPSIDGQSETMQAAASIMSPAVSDSGELESSSDYMDYGGLADIMESEGASEETPSEERDSLQRSRIRQTPQCTGGSVGDGGPESGLKETEKTQQPVMQRQPEGSVSCPVTTKTFTSPLVEESPVATSVCDAGNAPIGKVTLLQWISQIASKDISLPVLPPRPASKLDKNVSTGDVCLGRSVEIPHEGTDSGQLEKAVIRRKSIRKTKKTKNTQKNHKCPECGKDFATLSLLISHGLVHTGEKPFHCHVCGMKFRCVGFLNSHLTVHSELRPFKCHVCDKGFRKRGDLVKHEVVHTGVKAYKCTICGKGFSQGYYLKIHRESHTSKNIHHCTHCEKSFPTAFQLSCHERYHTMERPYSCQQCGKSFIYASHLKRHQGYHIGDRQFLCSVCGKAFVYMFDLKRHQNDHDKPRLQLPCTVCQKMFADKFLLRAHMRIHSSERPYKCEECGKAFIQQDYLKRHRRVHSDERPFACKVCEKSYKHSSHLNDHMRSHTGERPFQCSQCSKSFKFSEGLKNHKRTHTDERAERTRSFDQTRNHKRQKTRHKKS